MPRTVEDKDMIAPPLRGGGVAVMHRVYGLIVSVGGDQERPYARAARVEIARQGGALERNLRRRDRWIEECGGAAEGFGLPGITGLDAGIDRPAEQQRIGGPVVRGGTKEQIARADVGATPRAVLGLGVQAVGGRPPFAVPHVAIPFRNPRRRRLDLSDLGPALRQGEHRTLRPRFEQRIVELDLHVRTLCTSGPYGTEALRFDCRIGLRRMSYTVLGKVRSSTRRDHADAVRPAGTRGGPMCAWLSC